MIKLTIIILISLLFSTKANCQSTPDAELSITVLNEQAQPAEGATVELVKENKVIKAGVTNNKGLAAFQNIIGGNCSFSVTHAGYQPHTIDSFLMPSRLSHFTITLVPFGNTHTQAQLP